jgi:GntR family transcriptional regulator, transcriptional repressor for pyruvate dehydrogenase complex
MHRVARQTVERTSVSDQVFRILSREIFSGRYPPGELLPTQRTLAADLGVNMTSLREAVKRLEQLRLVESRQGEGMRVRDWRSDSGLDVLVHLIVGPSGIDPHTLGAVLEARRLMLTEAARLAARRSSREQAELLVDLADRIAAADSAEEAQRLDFSFFAELVDAAGNVLFVLITNSIRDLYLQNASAFLPLLEDRGSLVRHYRRAALAVRSGDPARAAGAVRRLAEEQERRLLAALS